MKHMINTETELANVFEEVEKNHNLKNIFISGMSFYGFVDCVEATIHSDRVDLEKIDGGAAISLHVSSAEYVHIFEGAEVGDGYPYETFGLIQLKDGSSIQLMTE